MKNLFYFLAVITLFAACKGEEIVDIKNTPIVNPPTMEVEGSITGTVLDDSGAYVPDATVNYRGSSTSTDKYGRFTFENTQLFEDGTYLTVNKVGFFPGSRKFYAAADQHASVTIQLLERKRIASISSSEGGLVEFETASVDLPSGDYKRPNGETFTGNVTVYATWLNPALDNIYEQMPGVLTGINAESELMALKTYGMIAVELEDASGNLVQLPDNEKATITLPIPAELANTAPATIPLWYFDEVNGTWIEEGQAELINGEYVGEVGHFTYWNCDDPFEFVTINGSIELNGNPLSNYRLKITASQFGLFGVTYTDNNGNYNILVPKDQALVLEIAGHCGTVVDGISLGSFSADTDNGLLTTSATLGEFTLVGEVLNCGGQISEFAYVKIVVDGGFERVVIVEEDGSFIAEYDDCQGNSVTITAYDAIGDPAGNKISDPITVFATGFEDLGVMTTCNGGNGAENTVLVYENQDFGNSVSSPDSVFVKTYKHTTSDLGNGESKYVYEVTLLDWISARTAEGTFTFKTGDTQAEYTLNLPQGFSVSGNAEVSDLPNLRFSDIGTDITITDTSLYPGGIDKVFFDFKF